MSFFLGGADYFSQTLFKFSPFFKAGENRIAVKKIMNRPGIEMSWKQPVFSVKADENIADKSDVKLES